MEGCVTELLTPVIGKGEGRRKGRRETDLT